MEKCKVGNAVIFQKFIFILLLPVLYVLYSFILSFFFSLINNSMVLIAVTWIHVKETVVCIKVKWDLFFF